MSRQHPRAFTVSVVWTLLLLWLGSIVHATHSSLACPDWPTCHGTMVPVMTGGVFWEHLHRLVAGGLVLMWLLATWLARRETRDRPWIFKTALAGVALLLFQAVLGGLTVIFRLPPAVSTAHLASGMTFLALVTVLASSTAWSGQARTIPPHTARSVRRLGLAATILVFVQCVLGALVRHLHAGLACPDAPLCLGRLIPPLGNYLVVLQFAHRVNAVLVAAALIGLATWALKVHAPHVVKVWASWAAVLVLLQIALGLVTVLTALAVLPDSLHTLVAAGILTVLVHFTTLGWAAKRASALDAAPVLDTA
ncbi:MAG: COX15/CtaA family protein [Gemmatimonadetes bacterium]|nr:COX15/CtaA family protein [Gemmatimonadota bacterium]